MAEIQFVPGGELSPKRVVEFYQDRPPSTFIHLKITPATTSGVILAFEAQYRSKLLKLAKGDKRGVRRASRKPRAKQSRYERMFSAWELFGLPMQTREI